MNNINEKLIGKTIKEADIDGFGVYLTFNDGSMFEYDASDGGYSHYAYCESPQELIRWIYKEVE